MRPLSGSFPANNVGSPAWVAAARLTRKDLLDTHVVLPAIGEVVFVHEALADTQAKVSQAHVSGIVPEADPAVMTDAVLTPVNDETI